MKFQAISSALIITAVLATGVLAQEATTSTTTPAQSLKTQTSTEREATKTALDAYKATKRADTEAKKLEAGKKYLTNLITVRERAIVKLQTQVASGRCSQISTSRKTIISTQLSAITTNLTAQKAEITALTTSDTVKTKAKEIIEENRVFLIVGPGINGQCMSTKIIEQKEKKLDALVTRLKELGTPTATAIAEQLTLASTKAQSAYDMYKEAVDTRASNPTAMIESANTLLREAKVALQDAQTSIATLEKTN